MLGFILFECIVDRFFDWYYYQSNETNNDREGKTMARSKRNNYAKVKIWMPNMISDVEGTIAGVAFQTFAAIGDKPTRELVLKAMTERHEAMTKREEERAAK